jgi:SRSO17 transposase
MKTNKTKDARKQELSGKGLTRVQIAQKVVDSLRAKLEAAETRLDAAKKAEAAGGAKSEEKKERVRVKAVKAMLAAGVPQAVVISTLVKAGATKEEVGKAIADALHVDPNAA